MCYIDGQKNKYSVIRALLTGFLLGLFFDPKDGSEMSTEYMALYPGEYTYAQQPLRELQIVHMCRFQYGTTCYTYSEHCNLESYESVNPDKRNQ
jgi:hypothetical protein